MGAEVTLVEAADRLVPLEDADVSRHLARGLKKRGIDVQTGARLEGAERLASGGVRATVRTARGSCGRSGRSACWWRSGGSR